MNLYIRADADSKIGIGHIMRCIALAQAWQDRGGEVTFISHCESEALRQRIIDEGFGFIPIEKPYPDPSDLKQTLEQLSAISYQLSANCWLVLDGYHFTPDYQKAIRDVGICLLVIDDMNHLPHYHADILLNQNIHAQDLKYNCDEDTTLLLGTRYVLLRREFLKYRDFNRQIPDKAKNILVTLGGADPDNVTLKVFEAIKLLNDPSLEVKIVVGPSNHHIAEIKNSMLSAPCPMHCIENAGNMPELMIGADLAITAGGSTCWELAFMGSAAIVGRIADVEELLIKGLRRHDLFIDAGWFRQLVTKEFAHLLTNCMMDKAWRVAMNKKGPKVVDGLGSMRVIETVLQPKFLTEREN
jgi:UDP-2,4-diacetamido-2,4,6-trideoxy-beta-L-altropyranose hydrolase